MSNIIEMQGVSKSYRMGMINVPVVRGVDLNIKKGEFIAILGKSGSGKTTLLNLIGLLDDLTEGKYVFNETNTKKLDAEEKTSLRLKKMGFVFQFFNLLPELNAMENIRISMTLAGIGEKQGTIKAKEFLEQVGLAEKANNFPNQLSGGEMQRLAIARALPNNPELLLADEPTGNLDIKNEQVIMDIFKEIHKKGTTIIMVTHDPDIAKIADRIIYLRDGRIAESL